MTELLIAFAVRQRMGARHGSRGQASYMDSQTIAASMTLALFHHPMPAALNLTRVFLTRPAPFDCMVKAAASLTAGLLRRSGNPVRLH
jgi:hypothetical protein